MSFLLVRFLNLLFAHLFIFNCAVSSILPVAAEGNVAVDSGFKNSWEAVLVGGCEGATATSCKISFVATERIISLFLIFRKIGGNKL